MTISEQWLLVCVIKEGRAVQGDRTMAVLTIRAYPYQIVSSGRVIYQLMSEMSVCAQAVLIPTLVLRDLPKNQTKQHLLRRNLS